MTAVVSDCRVHYATAGMTQRLGDDQEDGEAGGDDEMGAWIRRVEIRDGREGRASRV